VPPDGQDLTLNHLDPTMLWQALLHPQAPCTIVSIARHYGVGGLSGFAMGFRPRQGMGPSDLLCQGPSREWADPYRACPVCAPLRKVRLGIGVKQGPMD